MNSGPLIFLGLFCSVALSFWGFILAPQLQIGRTQQSVTLDSQAQLYPTPRPGLAQRGLEVYVASGCAECHTQQVQPRGASSDAARGWGQRRSVARDFLFDDPVQLGQLRLGPDLSNIGLRQTNAFWHLAHLYDPNRIVPGSPMPRYPYLFEKRQVSAPSPEALPFEGVEAGFEIVAKPEARELVDYLLSLKNEVSILEAQLPPPPTNQPPAGVSNVVEASSSSAPTNAPAQ